MQTFLFVACVLLGVFHIGRADPIPFFFQATPDTDVPAVYADEAQPVVNDDGSWTFANNGTNKINWYIYNSATYGDAMLVDAKYWYAVIEQKCTQPCQLPFIVVYTQPDDTSNNAASWYKSKLFYGISYAPTAVGGRMLLWGTTGISNSSDFSAIHPEIENRVQLIYNPALSAGPQNNTTEKILSHSLQTTLSAAKGQYDFVFTEYGISSVPPTSPSTDGGDSSSSLSSGAIAGIVIGSLVGASLIVYVVVKMKRRSEYDTMP